MGEPSYITRAVILPDVWERGNQIILTISFSPNPYAWLGNGVPPCVTPWTRLAKVIGRTTSAFYRRIHRGDPKFWPSEGVLGRNLPTISSPECQPAGQLARYRSPFRVSVRLHPFQPKLVVNSAPEFLLAAQVSFGCLDGDVTQEKLNLFQLSSREMAQTSARPP
jgi:hypothetical protein